MWPSRCCVVLHVICRSTHANIISSLRAATAAAAAAESSSAAADADVAAHRRDVATVNKLSFTGNSSAALYVSRKQKTPLFDATKKTYYDVTVDRMSAASQAN